MLSSLAPRAAVLAVVCAGFVAAAPADAAGGLPGSVMYDKANNVYVTDGVTTRQVTTNGGTPSADKTGSTGYREPTETDDGSLVVAVRNQDVVHQSDQQHYLRGYLWVMDAYGHVIRKINPPQYAYDNGTVCGLPANNPQGIFNAQVSPDGKHIAYTIQELAEIYGIYGCYVGTAYRTTVVNIDGSDPVAIDDGSGDSTAAEDLEIGSWVSNNQLLVDRGDFGSVESYVETLPSAHASAWFGPNDYTDTAYAQGDVRNHILVTGGLSDQSNTDVVRIWSTTGYGSTPTYRCEQQSTVDAANDYLGDPSLAPDGSAVAYNDTNGNGTVTKPGQGIYTMATAGATCGTPHLLVADALDAYWSPASVAPPADTTPPTVRLDAPTAAGVAASSFGARWTGTDVGTGIASYQEQLSSASYDGGYTAWADHGEALAPSQTQATVSGLAAGRSYCLRIKATDQAGNVAYSAPRCVAVALDDRSLSASAGWRHLSGRGYYAGTASKASARNATLRRTRARAARIGVVVTVGSGRGKLAVYDGTQLLGTVNTAARTTRNKVIRWLPAFSLRSATVKLKVTTSGKPVTVDGLLLARQ